MHKIYIVLTAENSLCVEKMDLFVKKLGHIPLFWLPIGLVICELFLGRI